MDSPSGPPEGAPYHMLILDFCPPELWENELLLLKAAQFVVFRQPLGTSTFNQEFIGLACKTLQEWGGASTPRGSFIPGWSHVLPGTWAKQGTSLQELSHAPLLFFTLKVTYIAFARIPLARSSHVALSSLGNGGSGAVQIEWRVGSIGDTCW